MACLWYNQNQTCIDIPSTEDVANVTYYIIVVSVGEIKWKVKHRYSEFYNLHNKLVSDHGVSKDILPSKKVIGNKSDVFIESRRKSLEEYVQKIFVFLKRTMPKIFVEFLEFNVYDIYFFLQDLSIKYFEKGDSIASSTIYSFTPLELYAVSEYLKKPFLNVENILDLGPILDMYSQLINLKIVGSPSEYLQSNIKINKLPFELTSFKILNTLRLKNISLDMIQSLGNLRNTVRTLKVYKTSAQTISDILQCDVLHKNSLEGSQKWTSLETLDLSNNDLKEIDKTISLAVSLKSLILDNNKISCIENLSSLPKLENLSIINNLITVCNELHTKVGNIKSLNLSRNSINTAKGFNKLFSLENLDLSCNKINKVEELEYLRNLPCLENVTLNGNNVSTTVDYRIRVLVLFEDRAKYICLDNEKPSEAELDKVSVLNALQMVKQGKTPNLTLENTSHT